SSGSFYFNVAGSISFVRLALEVVVQQRLEPTIQSIPCPRHIVLLSAVLIFAHPQIPAQRES
ncbi:hypothetical protein H5410_036978, partial [Solanum commersonii]